MPASSPDFGLNLPTRTLSGPSGTGAFAPGLGSFSYGAGQLEHMRTVGFTAVQLPINIVAANE